MKCPVCNGTGECDEAKVVINNITINEVKRKVSDEDIRQIQNILGNRVGIRNAGLRSFLTDEGIIG